MNTHNELIQEIDRLKRLIEQQDAAISQAADMIESERVKSERFRRMMMKQGI